MLVNNVCVCALASFQALGNYTECLGRIEACEVCTVHVLSVCVCVRALCVCVRALCVCARFVCVCCGTLRFSVKCILRCLRASASAAAMPV